MKRCIDDFDDLLSEISKFGYSIASYSEEPRSFGDFVVTISKGERSHTISCDRSQLMLKGERYELEPFGLWKAFDSKEEFKNALIAFFTKTG
jgi:hypothetical protein